MEKIVFAKDITLYKADCLEVMPFLPESSIDLVLCDPPFGITASQWDKIIPFPEMWKEIRRVRKENAPTVLFGSEPFSSFLRCGNLDEFKYDWVWEKSKASNFLLAKKQPLKVHELISVFGRGKTPYYPIMEEGEPYGNRTKRGSNWTGINNVPNPTFVLDFASGSMSTAIACINTNRKCICIEKDETHFSQGEKRVRSECQYL